MNALEWLPLVYPPGLFNLRDKDGTLRRGISFSQHPMPLRNNTLMPPSVKADGPSELYTAGFMRHMSMAIGDPSHTHMGSLPPNLFMACQAAAAAAGTDGSLSDSPSGETQIPFDLSRHFPTRTSLQTMVGGSEGVSAPNSRSTDETKDQPLDLRVPKNRIDENQNILSSPDHASAVTPPLGSPLPAKEALTFPILYRRNLTPALPLNASRGFSFSPQMSPLIQRTFHDVIGKIFVATFSLGFHAIMDSQQLV